MKMIQVLIAAALFFVTSCAEFERNIEKVDGEFPLSLGFEFIESDIAPGDTVTLRTYWSGNPKVDPGSLTWEVSWKFFLNKYSEEILLERQSLQPYIVDGIKEIPSGTETQVFEMKIAIPDDIIAENPGIPDDFTDLFSSYGIDVADPSVITSKDEMLALLDSISDLTSMEQAEIPEEMGYLINGVSQFCSVLFRVFCDNTTAGGFMTTADHSVRYHSKMKDVPGVFVNYRPETVAKRLYKVKGEHDAFDPLTQTADETIEIQNDSLELVLDTSYTYFFEQEFAQRDSTITTNEAFGDQMPSYEEFWVNYSYNEDAYETVGFISQNGLEYQQAGIPRILSKLNFADEPRKGKLLLVRMLAGDIRMGTSNRPRAVEFSELKLILK